MFDDISPAVERALQAINCCSPASEFNAAHLILALIEDEEGRAAQVIAEAGGVLADLKSRLATAPAVLVTLPAALTGAREVAGARAEITVTGEFLLLGILKASEAIHAPFQESGVRVGDLVAVAEPPTIPWDNPLQFHDSTDTLGAARALDANANRAREALRVLEDYTRFVLNDAILSAELKALRHQLAELLAKVPPRMFTESRETLLDVGTAITASGEMFRGSTAEIAIVNGKRLQEALRSLEEFAKLVVPELAPGLEAVRYRAYTVERSIAIGTDSRDRLAGAMVYVLVTGSQCLAALDWTIKEAADGGADVFQLREKGLTDRELIERARNVRRWTRETGTLFIVNDRPDVARLVEADGVHLGQDDMAVAEARRIMGVGPLIGVSTHEPRQVERAIAEGANYIGVGPTFPSATKSFSEFPGLDFVAWVAGATTVPAFAIGGITAENVAEVVARGLRRVAVSSAICQADEPGIIAARLRNALR